MMMVVMTHSVNVYQLDGYEWIQYFWILIMTYTMPLFMMISGFWYKQRNTKYCLKHYLYPCLVFSVINIVGGGNLWCLSRRKHSVKNGLGYVVYLGFIHL